jgi:hypothetical protein
MKQNLFYIGTSIILYFRPVFLKLWSAPQAVSEERALQKLYQALNEHKDTHRCLC